MAEPAIQLKDVSVVRDNVVLLDRVTAVIPRRGLTAIIGPNGAGKTTLILAILGLTDYTGSINFPRDAHQSAPRLGYVPQRLDFDRGSPITVIEFVALRLQRRPLWMGISPAVRDLARSSLTRVQAQSLERKPLGRLSGGELQRVQLATALLGEPSIVLLDEPVSGVDVVGERLFCDLLEQIKNESKLTMVLVSHDLSVVSRHATHVICLNRIVQCEGPAPKVLNSENLKAIYGPHAGLYEHHESHGHHHHHSHAHDHPPILLSPDARIERSG